MAVNGYGAMIYWEEPNLTEYNKAGYAFISSGGIGCGHSGAMSGWSGTGGSGGVSLSGRVWSSQSQLIYVSVGNGAKMPVWVNQGWNDLDIWYPYQFPDDTYVDGQIQVESEGYILIPLGFIIKVEISNKVEKKPPMPKPTDVIKFKDFIDYQLIRGHGDIDEDDIENINLEDFTHTDLIEGPKIIYSDNEDEINLQDFSNTTLILGPRIIDSPATDDIIIEDFVGYESEEEFNVALKEVDGLGLDDFIDIHKEV